MMIMNPRFLICACVFSLVLGCDFFDSQAKKVEIIRLEQQQAERVATERKDAAAALRSYIEGKCRLIEDDYRVTSNRLAEVMSDISTLEKAVADAARSETNAELSVEVRFLRILKSETVDALALKYLSRGFSVQREILISRIREVRAQDREYRDALRKVESAFDVKVSDSKAWVGDGKDQREVEVKRLRGEIAELERLRKTTRQGLTGTRQQEKERSQKLDDLDREITTKRRQIDVLRNPTSSRLVETQADSARQTAYDRATTTKRNELWDIDRRLKPKTTALDVVKEVESDTIAVLRKELDGRRTALSARLSSLERKVRKARECLLEVAVSDGDELKKLRAKVDRDLNLDVQ